MTRDEVLIQLLEALAFQTHLLHFPQLFVENQPTHKKLDLLKPNPLAWAKLIADNLQLQSVAGVIISHELSDYFQKETASLLHLAIILGKSDLVRWLLDNGCEQFINRRSTYGYTALTLAAEFGHEEILFTLIEHGALDSYMDGAFTPLQQVKRSTLSNDPQTLALYKLVEAFYAYRTDDQRTALKHLQESYNDDPNKFYDNVKKLYQLIYKDFSEEEDRIPEFFDGTDKKLIEILYGPEQNVEDGKQKLKALKQNIKTYQFFHSIPLTLTSANPNLQTNVRTKQVQKKNYRLHNSTFDPSEESNKSFWYRHQFSCNFALFLLTMATGAITGSVFFLQIAYSLHVFVFLPYQMNKYASYDSSRRNFLARNPFEKAKRHYNRLSLIASKKLFFATWLTFITAGMSFLPYKPLALIHFFAGLSMVINPAILVFLPLIVLLPYVIATAAATEKYRNVTPLQLINADSMVMTVLKDFVTDVKNIFSKCFHFLWRPKTLARVATQSNYIELLESNELITKPVELLQNVVVHPPIYQNREQETSFFTSDDPMVFTSPPLISRNLFV